MNNLKNNLIMRNGLEWSFLWVWALAIALFWPGEEPAKINTLFVVAIVFCLAYFIIHYAYKSKIITSKIYWMAIFMIMMTLTALILLFILNISDIGHREIDGFDPVRYDYEAKIAVENGWDFSLAKGSYNFLGIIYYIAGIYWLFGISTFYVCLFNLLFVLTGFLAITKILIDRTGETRPWQKMAWGMLLPNVLYYAALPSKDILAMSLIALIFCLVSRLLLTRKFKLLLPLIICSLGLTGARANALIIVFIVSLFILLLTIKNLRFFTYAIIVFIALLLIFIQLAPNIVEMLGGTQFSITKLLDLKQNIKISEELSAPGSLNLMFTPRNYFQVFLYAPIRTIFLLVAPFPKIWIWGQLSKIRFDVLSLWLILLFMPALIAATISSKIRRLEVYKFIVIPFWLMLIIISIGLFLIAERFRLMVTPFWLATILLAYCYAKPQRYFMVTLGVLFLGIISYSLLKILV